MRRGFTRMDSAHLLSGNAKVFAFGEIAWSLVNGAWRGICAVTAEGFDMNGAHRGRTFSHVQTVAASGEQDQTKPVPDWFFPLALGDTVGDGDYRRVLFDAARCFDIEAKGVRWTDPPDGVTMTTIDLVREFAATVSDAASEVPYGDGSLLVLPWSLGDGESVSIYVKETGPGLFDLTDRGLVADALAIAGVDLASKGAGSSWRAVRHSLELAPLASRPVSLYELTASTDRAGLGWALTELGEAMLRADGLRALGRAPSRARFTEAVIQRASGKHLKVIPRARLRTRFGSDRTVTCKVEGRDWAFVQALSAGPNVNEAYDHARSIFGDTDVGPSHLVAVVADGALLEDWQRKSLAGLSTVITESEQDEFWTSLAS